VKILLIICNKGGTGKTTLARNLICEFARRGYNTLGLDVDPQATLSTTMRIKPQPGFYNWIARDEPFENVARPVPTDVYLQDGATAGAALLIPGNWESASVHRAPTISPLVVRHNLIRAADAYALDIAVIDPPPSESEIHPFLLYAADYILIPVEVAEECFNEETGALANTYRYIHEHQAYRRGVGLPESKIIGIQPTRYEPVGWASRKGFLKLAQERYSDLLWPAIQSRKEWTDSVMVREAVVKHAPDSVPAIQMRELAVATLMAMGVGE
jgi:cellulose biosynthesis protein BcsQ